MIHELKTDPEVFEESWLGNKQFEIRKDDRDFQISDTLILKETKYTGYSMARGADLIFTGRQVTRVVTCKTTGYGLEPDMCILGVRMI